MDVNGNQIAVSPNPEGTTPTHLNTQFWVFILGCAYSYILPFRDSVCNAVGIHTNPKMHEIYLLIHKNCEYQRKFIAANPHSRLQDADDDNASGQVPKGRPPPTPIRSFGFS